MKDLLFIYKLINGKIDSSALLSLLDFNVTGVTLHSNITFWTSSPNTQHYFYSAVSFISTTYNKLLNLSCSVKVRSTPSQQNKNRQQNINTTKLLSTLQGTMIYLFWICENSVSVLVEKCKKNFLKMVSTDLENLIQFSKKTNVRNSISVSKYLVIILRYLKTGKRYHSLMYPL